MFISRQTPDNLIRPGFRPAEHAACPALQGAPPEHSWPQRGLRSPAQPARELVPYPFRPRGSGSNRIPRHRGELHAAAPHIASRGARPIGLLHRRHSRGGNVEFTFDVENPNSLFTSFLTLPFLAIERSTFFFQRGVLALPLGYLSSLIQPNAHPLHFKVGATITVFNGKVS